MFVHEYSDKEFVTYEECREDLLPEIDEEDISHHLDLTVPEIVWKFLRYSEDDFINWFAETIANAEENAIEELITEYEEGEVE